MLLVLAACSRGPEGAAATDAKAADATVECSLGGATRFTRDCTVERVHGDKGEQIVVRHPDGGFRRFDVLTNGNGLAAADGAQAADVHVGQDAIEVTVGDDRYRFPATVVNHGGR